MKVPRELVPWITAHGLTDLWQPLLHTTTAWIASAAPAWATDAQRATACMDLGTCFFILDDSPDDVALARYTDLERIAGGAEPDPLRPLQGVFAALFERLAATGASLAHYRALRVEFARALGHRHALRARREGIGADEYFALREITIYFAPWLSTWELLGGFVLSPTERALVAPAFVAANRWQVLENERVSVARDALTGTPNIVALYAAERGLSLANADRAIAERADAELAGYRIAMRALCANTPSHDVATYLAALSAAIVGARHHHHRMADRMRYAPS